MTFVCNHKKFMTSINFVFKVYHVNISGIREQILSDTATTIYLHCRNALFAMILGLGIYACYPTYDFLFNGNLTLVSPMLIPFVNQHTVEGYLILTFVNVIAAGYATFGTYAFNCFILIYVDVCDGLVSLIEYDFKVFDSMCEFKSEIIIVNKRTLAFRNIMLELMDLARYMKTFRKLSVVESIRITLSKC